MGRKTSVPVSYYMVGGHGASYFYISCCANGYSGGYQMTTPNQSAEESPRNWRERFIETFGIRTGIMSFIEVELMAERSLLAEKEQEFKSELTAMRGNRDTLNAVRNIIGVKEFHSVIDKAKELVAEHDKLLGEITRLEGELSRYDIIKRQ